MAMEHKAFHFRYAAFEAELRPILESSLRSGEPGPLAAFIDAVRQDLRDPYEGQPLGDDWRESLGGADVHAYGDFALTRYYDPADDRGLGPRWQAIQGALGNEPEAVTAVLGQPVGFEEHWFDPGRMGSYFQSESDVVMHLERVERLALPGVEPLVNLLRGASHAGAGLYVTF